MKFTHSLRILPIVFVATACGSTNLDWLHGKKSDAPADKPVYTEFWQVDTDHWRFATTVPIGTKPSTTCTAITDREVRFTVAPDIGPARFPDGVDSPIMQVIDELPCDKAKAELALGTKGSDSDATKVTKTETASGERFTFEKMYLFEGRGRCALQRYSNRIATATPTADALSSAVSLLYVANRFNMPKE
jgi:hypothetical protein